MTSVLPVSFHRLCLANETTSQAETWAFAAYPIPQLLDKRGGMNPIFQAEKCSGNSDASATYILDGPDRLHIVLEDVAPLKSVQSEGADATNKSFSFTPPAVLWYYPERLAGDYTLTVYTNEGKFSQTRRVKLEEIQKLKLLSQSTGNLVRSIRIGRTVDIDYSVFSDGEQVLARLYHQTGPNASDWKAVGGAWWVETPSAGGTLNVPSDTPPGNYLLIACVIAGCQVRLDEDSVRADGTVHWLRFAVIPPAATYTEMPDSAVIAYYDAINFGLDTGDFRPTYNLYSGMFHQSVSYYSVAAFYAGKGWESIILLERPQVIMNESQTASVSAAIAVIDRDGQQQRLSLLWNLVQEDGHWRLNSFEEQ